MHFCNAVNHTFMSSGNRYSLLWTLKLTFWSFTTFGDLNNSSHCSIVGLNPLCLLLCSLFVCSTSFDTHYYIVLALGFGVVRHDKGN